MNPKDYDNFKKIYISRLLGRDFDSDDLNQVRLSKQDLIKVFDGGYVSGAIEFEKIRYHSLNYLENIIHRVDSAHRLTSNLASAKGFDLRTLIQNYFSEKKLSEDYSLELTELVMQAEEIFRIQLHQFFERIQVENQRNMHEFIEEMSCERELFNIFLDEFGMLHNILDSTKKELKHNMLLKDSLNNELIIKVKNPSYHECKKINLVTLTARYDHGFGFSQLYRFVKDKDSQVIKDYCDLAMKNNAVKLLPLEVSENYKVLVTPSVKGNSEVEKEQCKVIMKEILNFSQSDHAKPQYLLITQFKHMRKYRDQQFHGILAAIKELQESSFGSLKEIYFEINSSFEEDFIHQIGSVLSVA